MKQVNSYIELERLVLKMGFLPFFRNNIPEFSVEDFTPGCLWFSDDEDGPWEWKGPVVRNWNCVYGKLFNKKAGFVSMEWFPELVNYRRSQYNFITNPLEIQDKLIHETVIKHESLLSTEIKSLCGYAQRKKMTFPDTIDSTYSADKAEKAGFETVITRLQMGTWIIVADFEYQYNKQGEPYGWGIARYTTPEALFGKDKIYASRHHSPEESKLRLTDYLTRLLPQATPAQILKIIG
jgi:hypothetical protein